MLSTRRSYNLDNKLLTHSVIIRLMLSTIKKECKFTKSPKISYELEKYLKRDK